MWPEDDDIDAALRGDSAGTGYPRDRESNGTGWFIAIIVSLGLMSIGYLAFAALGCGAEVCIMAVETPQ